MPRGAMATPIAWMLAVLGVGCLVEFPLPEGGAGSTAPEAPEGPEGSSGSSGSSGSVSGASTSEDAETASTDTGAIPRDDKWMRVAAIVSRYADGLPDAAETARFDLVVATTEQARTWAGAAGDSWTSLRALNPEIRLYLAVESPGNYAPYEGFGDGWDFITRSHGIGSADRWTAIGVDYPTSYLQWSTHWAMTLEPASWRAYHMQSVSAGLRQMLGDAALAQIDGVYIVATDGYRYPHYGAWEVEVSPGVLEPDHPADYHDGVAYDDARWSDHFDLYLDEAIDYFASLDPPLQVAVGFSGLHELEHWQRLDGRAEPIAFAFTNAGLLQQWGSTYNVTHFGSKLGMIEDLGRIGLVHGNQGAASEIPGEGLAKMDALATTGPGEGATQMTGWEALWFSLCGHMAAIDTTRDDQYFYFSVWGFDEIHWLDEYDPEILHLGDPMGSAFELDGATMREFDDGWVVLNGTQADLADVRVPSGRARVIGHAELHSPELAPLVETFDLPLHRGVVLLRDGAVLGR